jgi:molybdate transport system substrate-binding protein
MFRRFFCAFTVITWCLSSQVFAQSAKTELLLYCGITMVRPMTEIARVFETRENVKLVIAQGGSEDLYQSAQKSGIGDWYLPGDPSFRIKHIKEGLLGDFVTVGYNQMVLMVQKGNPKQVKADPQELLRKDLTIVLGNESSGSVGKESKVILESLGIYQKVLKATTFLATDSLNLVLALKKKEADLTMNFRAVGYFSDNVASVDVIELDPKLSKPQALELNLLTSSKHVDLARRFMALTASEEGQIIFRKHGFLDNKSPIAR